jgi:hypothetical protein
VPWGRRVRALRPLVSRRWRDRRDRRAVLPRMRCCVAMCWTCGSRAATRALRAAVRCGAPGAGARRGLCWLLHLLAGDGRPGRLGGRIERVRTGALCGCQRRWRRAFAGAGGSGSSPRLAGGGRARGGGRRAKLRARRAAQWVRGSGCQRGSCGSGPGEVAEGSRGQDDGRAPSERHDRGQRQDREVKGGTSMAQMLHAIDPSRREARDRRRPTPAHSVLHRCSAQRGPNRCPRLLPSPIGKATLWVAITAYQLTDSG